MRVSREKAAENRERVIEVASKLFRAAGELLSQIVPGRSKRAKRKRALAIYSSLVGALVLSRAVDDPELSTEILKATLASVSAVD